MKFLTINICPEEQCAEGFKKTLADLGPEKRANAIISLIQCHKPDVIFFIEEWFPTYGQVKAELEPEYKFVLPKGFNPARLNREGEYSSFSGVVAAVKSNIAVTSANGRGYVEKYAKWLSLEIDGHKYLGVHYPQPQSKIEPDENFHRAVLKFAIEEKPVAIMGDFNTPKNVDGGRITINGYFDALPSGPTYPDEKKLDYIFLSETCGGATAKLIPSAMSGDTVFSDHAATMVAL